MMRKFLLIATIGLLGTTIGNAFAQGGAPTTVPAAPTAPAQTVAPAAQAAKPAKPDRNQMIFEQLVKHGIIKIPNQMQQPAATAAAPAPTAAPATTTVAPATTPAVAPAPVPTSAPVQATVPPTTTQPVQAAPPSKVAIAPTVKVEAPKQMGRTESRIRAELRRHGIR